MSVTGILYCVLALKAHTHLFSIGLRCLLLSINFKQHGDLTLELSQLVSIQNNEQRAQKSQFAFFCDYFAFNDETRKDSV